MSKCFYAAIFTPFDDGMEGYTVTFPDLPGCITEGDNIAEAVQNAAEAASGWLKDVNLLPEPLSAESVRTYYASCDDLVYNIRIDICPEP